MLVILALPDERQRRLEGKHIQKRVPRWRDRVRVKSMQCAMEALEGGGIGRMIQMKVRAWTHRGAKMAVLTAI